MGNSTYREPGDDSWDYMRPYAPLRAHLMFKEIQDGVYECVILKSHPALMTTNSDDPPGSFHTRDLFSPHPVIENAWKYISRGDDRITLISGEKITPVGIEGAIHENPLVRDALMVGNDRLAPGVLVFRSPEAAALSDEEFIAAIWPSVQAGNQLADEFARITRDMIKPMGADVEYPVTDKNNIIRNAAYKLFQDVIEAMYQETVRTNGSRTNGDRTNGGQPQMAVTLSISEMEQSISDLIQEQAGIEIPDVQADFFATGVDSLRAAQIRRLLEQNFDLGGHSLATNIVYDAGNVASLARVLFKLHTGEKLQSDPTDGEREVTLMKRLIGEYGIFESRIPQASPNPEREVVVSDVPAVAGWADELTQHRS